MLMRRIYLKQLIKDCGKEVSEQHARWLIHKSGEHSGEQAMGPPCLREVCHAARLPGCIFTLKCRDPGAVRESRMAE